MKQKVQDEPVNLTSEGRESIKGTKTAMEVAAAIILYIASITSGSHYCIFNGSEGHH